MRNAKAFNQSYISLCYRNLCEDAVHYSTIFFLRVRLLLVKYKYLLGDWHRRSRRLPIKVGLFVKKKLPPSLLYGQLYFSYHLFYK